MKIFINEKFIIIIEKLFNGKLMKINNDVYICGDEVLVLVIQSFWYDGVIQYCKSIVSYVLWVIGLVIVYDLY